MNVHQVPPDHNVQASDDAIIVVQLSKLRASQRALASKNGEHRNVVKDVEAKGLSPKIAKEALRIAESGDAKAKLEELQTLVHYLRLLGVDLPGDQLEMFAESANTGGPLVDKAYEDGLRAGRMGESFDTCQHDPSTDAYRAFRDGHQIGARERDAIMSMPAPLFRDDEAGDDPETDEDEIEDA